MNHRKQSVISTGNRAYDVALETLIAHFETHSFATLANNGEHHRIETTVVTFDDCDSLRISFPGIKAAWIDRFKRYRYDFRVDLCDPKGARRAVSHAEIILDLFTKVSLKQMSFAEAQEFLLGVHNGKSPTAASYAPKRIPPEFINAYTRAHKQLKKFPQTPSPLDLEPHKLAPLLFFILLQEEVNYPSFVRGKRTTLSGKTLPIERYCEGIWAAAYAPQKLEEVLRRTLAEETRPMRWKGVTYIPYPRKDQDSSGQPI